MPTAQPIHCHAQLSRHEDHVGPLPSRSMRLDQRERAAVRVFVTGYILSVTSWYLAHLMVGR